MTLLYFILKKEHVWNKLKLYSYGSLWRNLLRWLYSTLVPILSPPGVMGLLSPAQVFLLTEISHSSRIRSTLAPSVPLDFRSTNTRWLSVPPGKSVSFVVRKYLKTSGCLHIPLSNIKHWYDLPETTLYPLSNKTLAMTLAFLITCSWYSLNSGDLA